MGRRRRGNFPQHLPCGCRRLFLSTPTVDSRGLGQAELCGQLVVHSFCDAGPSSPEMVFATCQPRGMPQLTPPPVAFACDKILARVEGGGGVMLHRASFPMPLSPP